MSWTNKLSWIFIVLAHWNNSPWIDTWTHYLDFQLTCLCSYSLMLIIGLTWPGPKPMIYHTWDEHTNHYTTCGYTPEEGPAWDEQCYLGHWYVIYPTVYLVPQILNQTTTIPSFDLTRVRKVKMVICTKTAVVWFCCFDIINTKIL